MGNLRETEISISPWGNYRKCVRLPKISATKNVGKFNHFFAVWRLGKVTK